MKICPVAIAVGCAKCPVVKVCPLKTVLGDYSAAAPAAAVKADAKAAPRAKSAPASSRPRPAGQKTNNRAKRRSR